MTLCMSYHLIFHIFATLFQQEDSILKLCFGVLQVKPLRVLSLSSRNGTQEGRRTDRRILLHKLCGQREMAAIKSLRPPLRRLNNSSRCRIEHDTKRVAWSSREIHATYTLVVDAVRRYLAREQGEQSLRLNDRARAGHVSPFCLLRRRRRRVTKDFLSLSSHMGAMYI